MKGFKSLGDIANLHDLRSIPRTRRSAKPPLPTTAILNLYMARNERDRLIKERKIRGQAVWPVDMAVKKEKFGRARTVIEY